MSTVSTMAVSSGYLCGRPLPCLGCGSCGGDSTNGCAVLSVLDS